MTRNEIDALVAAYLETQLDDVEERLAGSSWKINQPPANHGTWQDFADWHLADQLEEIQTALAEGDHRRTLGLARELLPNGCHETLQLLARRLLEAQYEAVTAERNGIAGEPLKRWRRPEGVAQGVPEEPPASGPLLSEMVDAYVSFKTTAGKWTPKTRTQLIGVFKTMGELIGDKPAAAITKADMRELYRLLPQMPSHAVKRYRGLPALDAIAAADADGNDERLSPKSQNDYFTHIKSLWKWAEENDYVVKSPAVVLKEVSESDAWSQRPAFTDEQLALYFERLKRDRAEPAMWWVPTLMLYAGLRTEEAAKLRPEDIREEEGVCLIDINRNVGRLKTKNADRLVPVHCAIREELVTFAQSASRGQNLWGLEPNASGVYSANLSKRLNARLDEAVPGAEKLVVYSLRHTFATKLKYAEIHPDMLDELLGHGVERLSTGRYGKRYRPEHLRHWVERIDIPLA